VTLRTILSRRKRNTLSELKKGQKYLEYEGNRESVLRNLGVLKKLGLGAAGALGLGVAKKVWDLIL